MKKRTQPDTYNQYFRYSMAMFTNIKVDYLCNFSHWRTKKEIK